MKRHTIILAAGALTMAALVLDDLGQISSFHSTLLLWLAAAGAVVVPLIMAVRLPSPRPSKAWPATVLAVAGAALCALGVELAGLRQFGGYDHSALVELAWRQYRGHQPNADFYNPFPAGFTLGARWAFELFGPSWRSLLHVAAMYSAVTFLWLNALYGRLLADAPLAWLATAATQALSMVAVAYWWYNPVTSVAGAVYALSALVLLREPRSAFAVLSCAAATAVLAPMKPNTAWLLMGATVAVLVSARPTRWRAAAATLGGVLAAFAAFEIAGLHFPQQIAAYFQVSVRGLPSLAAFGDRSLAQVATIAAAAVALALLGAVKRDRSLSWRENALLTVAGVVGAYAAMTDADLKIVSLPLMVVAVLGPFSPAATARPSEGVPPPAGAGAGHPQRRLAMAALAALVVIGTVSGGLRARVQSIGPGLYFEGSLADARVEGGFFDGMRAGRVFMQALRDLEAVRRENPQARIFFGPRMEFGYALLGIDAPPSLPYWWDPILSWRAADVPRLVADFEAFAPDIVVLPWLANETIWPAELQSKAREYYLDTRLRSIAVLHRRQESCPHCISLRAPPTP